MGDLQINSEKVLLDLGRGYGKKLTITSVLATTGNGRETSWISLTAERNGRKFSVTIPKTELRRVAAILEAEADAAGIPPEGF